MNPNPPKFYRCPTTEIFSALWGKDQIDEVDDRFHLHHPATKRPFDFLDNQRLHNSPQCLREGRSSRIPNSHRDGGEVAA